MKSMIYPNKLQVVKNLKKFRTSKLKAKKSVESEEVKPSNFKTFDETLNE